MPHITHLQKNLARRCAGAALGALVWLLAFQLSQPITRAQNNANADYEYHFGQTVTFTLELPWNYNGEARLYVRVANDTQLQTVAVTDGRAIYARDLRVAAFPPFAQVTYWWDYHDAANVTQTTSQTTFLYDDNRFTWHTLQQEPFTLHWVAGNESMMLTALDVARSALTEIQTALKITEQDELHLYAYPSQPDLQSAMRLTQRDWVGGQAYPASGVALLVIRPISETLVTMQNDIPHELTHHALYEKLGAAGYQAQPIWLIEGLASYFERNPDPVYAQSLQQALQKSAWIPMADLCHAFPTTKESAILAYAQSQSLLRYVVQQYGWSRVEALLGAYADGLECTVGVRQTLGLDLTAVEREWRMRILQGDRPDANERLLSLAGVLVHDSAPWLLLTALILLPGILTLLPFRAR